ncbi:MAG TPA: bifunctional diaminohydroxyphosphoribosylaminopyrimidine deaminase/5-amino-6-(5-phosphoribosylamino)uracil reductase RibD [Lentisphaeria bacterium]|nr:MAG: riboflavin biosynthesis protein RibD [Lentisphaerae bacterium GWF2_50_93]HCE43015.1 bifunctional diaminohydroxyphosphoribosylaminopyrimidine deaminase/5-amino-6-(5-phosphoribosylamino)uracil reductase RibD [Lentisphaeria bacterium]
MQSDIKFMSLALTLAKRGWGGTSPNPMVGAVVVKNGKAVGKGFHRRAGEAHAEVNALNDAGRNARNATLYVTLEPCCTFGRTPPCTDAIISSGIRKVVVGCFDPNPKHAGKGLKVLQKAGIEVTANIMEKECRELNDAFFHWITTGRPFVLLKMAMTLDGKIATSKGDSKWVTGPKARARVQKLRQWADAVMVGGETARTDKPSLTIREFRTAKQPRRIIISRHLTPEKLKNLLPPGTEPEVISPKNRQEWISELKRLGKENVTSILVEGGGELAAEMLNAGIIDKVEFHIAPKILGGRNSRPVVGGTDPDSLSKAFQLKNVSLKTIDEDICISGYMKE